MKSFHLLKLVMALCVPLCAMMPKNVKSQTVVGNCNLQGWTSSATNNATFEFFPTGPDMPPLPSGSAEFFIDHGNGKGSKLTTGLYTGTLLSTITELKYSTYIQDFGDGLMQADAIFLIIEVDYNNNGSVDDKLYYQPFYQANTPLTFALWQEWNALSGGWWSSDGVASATKNAIKPLANIIAAKPNAKIITIGLAAGYVSGDWDGFRGNADAFKIKVGTSAPSLYNFENNDIDNDGICDDVDACPGAPGGGDVYYEDADGDGFGNKESMVIACSLPPGYVTNTTDCDDTNPAMHPGGVELCNGVDDDCDGLVDDGVQIMVDAGQDVNVYYSGPGITVSGYPACRTLTANATGVSGTLTYSWSNGATTRSITVCPTESTIYSVIVSKAGACSGTDYVSVNFIDASCDSLVNIDEVLVCKDMVKKCVKVSAVKKLLNEGYTFGPCTRGGGGSGNGNIPVYPNPTSGKFSIDVSEFKSQRIQLQLSFNGVLVSKRDVNVSGKGGVEEFDISAKQNGVYFIKVISKDRVVTSKILKVW